MKSIRRLVLALLALTLLTAACGSDSDGEETTSDSTDDESESSDEPGSASDTVAAFIYVGPIGDAGYTFAHDEGRKAAEAATGATTLYIESVPEGTEDFKTAAVNFIENEGADLIVGTSFGYMEDMSELAEEYPDVDFEHVSGYLSNGTNFGNSFGRMYEPRFLSGMAAASVSESGRLGYVAAFPIPEVIRGINAFTLGAQSVNPDATVEVVWTSTWFDPTIEGNSAQALVDAGVDVIGMHQDTPAVGEVAQAGGIRWVGYNSDMSAFAPDAFVTAPVWNWGPRYTALIEATASDTFAGDSYWGGMVDDVVGLAPMADDVSAETVSAIEATQAEIIAGTFHPFQGPILDQDGTEVVAEGETLDDGSMLSMDYFVAGVVGSAQG